MGGLEGVSDPAHRQFLSTATDAETGLKNRTYLDDIMTRHIAASQENPRQFVLISGR